MDQFIVCQLYLRKAIKIIGDIKYPGCTLLANSGIRE